MVGKRWFPFLLILFVFFSLGYLYMPILAGSSILLGIVMLIEKKWPEQWENEKGKSSVR